MNKQLSMPKERIRVLLLEGIHGNAVRYFEEHGYSETELLPSALSGDELKSAIKDVHILGVRSRTQLDPSVLAAADKLFCVGCFCIGTDQVAHDHAAVLGIPVFHAPHANTRSVAELVIGFMIMLVRDVFHKSRLAAAGEWSKTASVARELRGKTLGIVGYGHIGSQVSVLAEAMGLRVLFHDVSDKLALGNARPVSSLDELLGASDIVSLHVPDTNATRGLMDARRLAAMKDGACLINTSRGHVVDLEALASELRAERLLGAAVDVFPQEPARSGDTFRCVLQGLDKVILTPHIAGSTLEAQESIALEVAGKIVAYSDRGTTVGAVNFPELQLAGHEGCHRVLHIHKNVPGIMRQIDRIFAERGLNIAAEYLQTKNGIGYVVLDTDPILAEDIMPALKAVDGTIRTRILY